MAAVSWSLFSVRSSQDGGCEAATVGLWTETFSHRGLLDLDSYCSCSPFLLILVLADKKAQNTVEVFWRVTREINPTPTPPRPAWSDTGHGNPLNKFLERSLPECKPKTELVFQITRVLACWLVLPNWGGIFQFSATNLWWQSVVSELKNSFLKKNPLVQRIILQPITVSFLASNLTLLDEGEWCQGPDFASHRAGRTLLPAQNKTACCATAFDLLEVLKETYSFAKWRQKTFWSLPLIEHCAWFPIFTCNCLSPVEMPADLLTQKSTVVAVRFRGLFAWRRGACRL